MGNFFNIINVPFGLLMSFFYSMTSSYALTLLFFTIVVQIVLLPLGIKQQRSQIRMAKIRPKEQIIRKKYAGRKDAATQQKMNQEVMEMYKRENYSPMSGCLPMLIQLPIIFALFNIVRRPLTYIAGFSSELIEKITEFLESAGAVITGADPEIQIVRAFEGTLESFEGNLINIRNAIDLIGVEPAQRTLFESYENMNFGFLGESLLTSPSENLWSPLIIIVILNFVAVFLQTRLTRKIQSKSALGDHMNNKSMKIMEYTMPVMILYFTYIMNSALGLYWIYRSITAILQTIILAKVHPIPAITEEDIKLAEQQYGAVKKKKKKKKPAEIPDEEEDENPDDEADDTKENDDDEPDGSGDSYLKEREDKDEKKNEVKKNYQKTGKQYTVKRRKNK